MLWTKRRLRKNLSLDSDRGLTGTARDVGAYKTQPEQWFEERYDEGFRYAWLVPGLSRVVQAAGRVIRSPEDRGAVVLVGRRFVQRDYAAFFPDDWTPVRSRDPAAALAGLWAVVAAGR